MRLRSTLTALALLAVACSSSTTAGGSGPDITEVPGLFATAFCAKFEECAGPVADLFLGGTDCEGSFGATLSDATLPLWQAAIERGTLVYDGRQADECLAAVEAGSCGLSERDQPECAALLEGAVAAGSPCTVEAECAGAAYCAFDGSCPGTCVARGSAGAACNDDAHCVSGLSCQANTGRCQANGGPGAACEGTSAPGCALPAICLGQDEEAGTPGTCTLLSDALSAPVGSACDPQAGRLCEVGAACVLDSFDVATMTLGWLCVAPSSPDGPCKLGIPDPCPRGQYCDADPEATGRLDGSCVDLPAAGEPCAESLGGNCAEGLVCRGDGTCGSIQRLGGSCTNGSQCASGSCDGSLCVVPECG